MASKTTAFPLAGPINLVLRLGHGSITVAAKDGLTEAIVGLSARSNRGEVLDRVVLEMRGSTLVVAGPRQRGLADIIGGWHRDGDGIDMVVEVPTGTAVKIAAASEDITVAGCCGDAEVAASSARITLETVGGDLRLRYSNGNSRIGTVTGSAQLRASSGSAHFGEVGGALDCKFGSGELIAEAVRGELHSRAGSGFALIGAVYGDVDLAFGSGPISLGLPGGMSAHLDIATGSGQLHSDFPIEPAAARAARTITVRARTGNGDIRLQRSAAA